MCSEHHANFDKAIIYNMVFKIWSYFQFDISHSHLWASQVALVVKNLLLMQET